MYVRKTGDTELELMVSGKLWRDSLVMLDKETGSHWSQISGDAFMGPHRGAELAVYPSEMTTWQEWVNAYPQTLVLEKSADQREKASRYAKYFGDDRQGIFGRIAEDERLPPKMVVVAVKTELGSMVFPTEHLPRDRVVQAELAGVPLAVVPAPGGGFVAYDRRIEGKAVDLSLSGHDLVDGDGRRWRASSGQALDHEQHLTPLRAHTVFWFGWVSFFPRAKIWSPR